MAFEEDGSVRVLGRALHQERNKFVHAFLHEAVRRLSAATGVGAEAWASFEASERWRPPHFQVCAFSGALCWLSICQRVSNVNANCCNGTQIAQSFVSAPSEFLFESLTGEMGADQNGSRVVMQTAGK